MRPAVDIRAARLRQGLSLTEAASEIGVDKSLLHRAERGQTTPRPGAALRIAQFYGLDVLDVWPPESSTTSTAEAAA